jgi:hypothetical protein
MYRLQRLTVRLMPHHIHALETVLLLLAAVIMFTGQASAVIRLADRSLLIMDNTPGVTTQYKVSFTYTTQASIGSVNMLFCIDPIPYLPCDPPPGLDVSNAVLSNQTGETGYTITTQTANHIVLSRTPGVTGSTPSSYTFDNIVNPNYTIHSYAIRLSDYTSMDATGPVVNPGSVLTQLDDGITLETQVPPMMLFCMAHTVQQNCTSTDNGHYKDLGTLSPTDTLIETSQMAVGTNASGGFVITANGTTMEAGTHELDALTEPTVSIPGNNQFGINTVANSVPNLGSDPDGPSNKAVAAPQYSQPNHFMYHDGDVIAEAPNVSLSRRFTVSYIVNSSPKLRAGVYTTTITFIATGRF